LENTVGERSRNNFSYPKITCQTLDGIKEDLEQREQHQVSSRLDNHEQHGKQQKETDGRVSQQCTSVAALQQ